MGLEHWLCSRTARHWKMLAAARLRSRSLSFTSTTEDELICSSEPRDQLILSFTSTTEDELISGLGTAYARRGSASIEEHRLGMTAEGLISQSSAKLGFTRPLGPLVP